MYDWEKVGRDHLGKLSSDGNAAQDLCQLFSGFFAGDMGGLSEAEVVALVSFVEKVQG